MPAIQSNGLRLEVEERGSGQPLVLVCGLGMQLVAWPEGFLDRLAARGLRVIVFDQRDVGLSSRIARRVRLRRALVRALLGLPVAAPYTVFDMADDLAGLLDALHLPRAHVAGVSLGGMVAQAMAIRHGHRLRSLVSMMSHPGGSLLTGRLLAAARLLRRPPRNREEAAAAWVDFFRAAGSRGLHRDDAAVAERAGRAFDRGASPDGFARQFCAVLATGDMSPLLRAVTTPTLVLHGTDDGIFRPEHGRRTARAIPGARFQLVPGWGHDLAEGAWDVLIEAISRHVLEHA